MKNSDPPKKKSGELKRSKPLSQGNKPLKTTKRLNPGKGIKARSKKMQKLMVNERIPFVIDFIDRHPKCEVHWDDYCTRLSCDVHEILPQGRGGKKIPKDGDESNFMSTCRHCHYMLTNNPAKAKELGFTK
jgi:hypothetical protein